MKLSKSRISVLLVILFHAVGLSGFLIPSLQNLFVQLVPFHLLLMLFLVVINHQDLNRKFLWFLSITIILGYTAEWIGVHTHLLFGRYLYDTALGFKLDNIPLMIGVNWFLLIYTTCVLLQKADLKNVWLKTILGATILVLLDLLIEPVAIRFNYWHWTEQEIPLKNYLCWFIVSAGLILLFDQFQFKSQNWVAPILLIVQFLFFAVLNFA